MKKLKKYALILILLLVNTGVVLWIASQWNGVSLEKSDKIEIYTTEDYLTFADAVCKGNSYENSVVLLCEDLEFEDFDDAKMIGSEEYPFRGIFDGDGHSITGLDIVNLDGTAGMFANLQGTVKNLQLLDCEFAGTFCGAVAAKSYNAAVLNCMIDADTKGETCGSIVGELHGNVINCVAPTDNFAGMLKKGAVEHCYIAGNEVVDELNKNLSYISGAYEDTSFYLWKEKDSVYLSNEKADLVEQIIARIEIDGKELKLQGYYSDNERKWCFVLPASKSDAVLNLEVRTSKGKYERFKRTNGDEAMIFTWKDIYYPIEFLSGDQMDTLYITLQKQKNLSYVHENKYEEIPGVMTIMDADGNVGYESIKGFYGHGNDSWAVEKKSYNLKFPSRVNLLGLGENEDFSLLACYRDNSLMCYATTTELMKELGFEYSPEFRFVNLYVAGEYAGVYFLAEKVELDENRINITNVYEETKKLNNDYLGGRAIQEWKDPDSDAARYYYEIENNPEDLTGGYLLEADIVDYGPDESRFVSERGIPMTMKRARYSSKEQVEYIAEFWQEFEDALFDENGVNDLGKHYTEYIDVESFAMQWLIYELVQEGSMSSSIYFYKESEISGDGLLHACFPWDMEHSYVMSDKINELWNTTEKAKTLYGYWYVFFQHEDFRDMLWNVWQEKFVPAIEVMIAEEAIETASGMRNLRWYEEHIGVVNRLENTRWSKMHPLDRCQTNREFLKIRKEMLPALLQE